MYFNHVYATIPDPFGDSNDFLNSSSSTLPLQLHLKNSRPQPTPKEQHPHQSTILPHWGAYIDQHSTLSFYTLNNQTYELQSLFKLFNEHNSAHLSTQIAQTILNSAATPAEAYSSILQDQVRLGQSNLLPQIGVRPSQIQPAMIQAQFIHSKADTLYPSAKINDIPLNMSSQTMLDVSSQELNLTSNTNTKTFLPLLNSPSQRYHEVLTNTTLSASTHFSPHTGFFFSDDSAIHSLLPHFSQAHQSVTSSPMAIPITDSFGNTVPLSRSRHHQISTLPNSQQHLPDQFNSYLESGLSSQHNREGEYPWVTPLIMLSWEPYKRLSLLTPAAQDDYATRVEVGCLHRRHLPRFFTLLLCNPCISQHLKIPSIQPTRQYIQLQTKFAEILTKYQQSLSGVDISDKNNKSAYTNLFSILNHVISSIQTAFNTPLSVSKDNDIVNNIPLPTSSENYAPHKAHLQLIENQQLEIDLAPFQTFNSAPILSISHPNQRVTGDDNPNHPAPMYTHDLAPNPTSAKNSTKMLSSHQYSAKYKDQMMQSHKLNNVQTSASATTVIAQPEVPILNTSNQFATKNLLLFNHNSESIPIYPFPTSTISAMFSNPLKYFQKTQLPRISCAQFLAPCFPSCIVTPMNLIKTLNSYSLRAVKTSSYSYQTFHDYHTKRIKDGLRTSSIPTLVIEDLHLQIATQHVTPSIKYYSPTSVIAQTCASLLHFFQAISQTPMFYLITPVSMSFLLGRRIESFDTVDCYSLFQALIRWTTYHTAMRYQSHQRACIFLKERKDEYLHVIQYSLEQYQLLQNDYLAKLQNHTKTQATTPSTKDRNPFSTTVHDVIDMMKLPQTDNEQPLLSSSQSQATIQTCTSTCPIPPPFTLQIPPKLQSKYRSHLDFINTSNPCEFCYRFEGIQVVFKPWTQPSPSISPNNTNDLTHALPLSVYDMNFFNLNTYHGFNFSSSIPSNQNASHLAHRYDLSSGKVNDQFGGHFLSFSPQTLEEITKSPPSVQHTLSALPLSPFLPKSTHNTNTSPNFLPFTAMFSSSPNDTSISFNQFQPHNQRQQSFPKCQTQLFSTNISAPFSHPYGLHIPSNIIRRELAPIFQLFPYATFTSSQLAQLFQQPSIFTPFEQFYILSSRTLPMQNSALNEDLDSPAPGYISPDASHPYYPGLSPNACSISQSNPHHTISPFSTINDILFETHDRNNGTQYFHDERYICQLFDDQTTYSHYHNSILNEMGKGFFAQAVNPQFNSQQTAAYTNFITALMYEKYQAKSQLNQPLRQDSVPGIGNLNDNSEPHKNVNVNIQDPYLKAFYTKYHHDLRSTLQSLPGYRDGLFAFDVSGPYENTFRAIAHHTDEELKFYGRFADTRRYTIAFPRQYPLDMSASDVTLSNGIHRSNNWISAEYLINTQQFTRNMLIEQSTLYPYINTARNNLSQPPNSSTNMHSIDEFDSLTPRSQKLSPNEQSNLGSISKTTMDGPVLTNNRYYSSQHNHTLPIALPTIHGTTFSHSTLTTNALRTNPTRLAQNFFPRDAFPHCCPNATLIWNWRIAPALGFFGSFASLVLLGLVYEKKMEPTPYSLIPLLLIATLLTLFPFLFTLQVCFEKTIARGSIFGFKKCCGHNSHGCHPTRFFMEETSWVESSFRLLTFGEDFDDDYVVTPSIGRFLSCFGVAWVFLSTYLHLSGLVQIGLLGFFLPLYACHGLQLIAGFHALGCFFFIEFVPLVMYLVSLGVLHGSLADPLNDKYNAVAVTAPFLLPFAAVVITAVIYFFASCICEDDCDIDCGTVLVVLGCFFLFCVASFWYAFLVLLLQDFIRPGTWWVPSFWATQTLTYLLFIFMAIALCCDGSDRDIGSATKPLPQSSHNHTDLITDFSRFLFYDESPQLSKPLDPGYNPNFDTMSRI